MYGVWNVRNSPSFKQPRLTSLAVAVEQIYSPDETLQGCYDFLFFWLQLLGFHPIHGALVAQELPMWSPQPNMTMVLNETLRLYPPANVIARKAYKKIKLGEFLLPKGTFMIFPILAVHRNEEFWGSDANLFRPERFAEGTSKAATHPNAFLPFSMGPRNCVGQNFAMLEAKTVLTMILQRLSFSISLDYKHAPTSVITLQPQHGFSSSF